LNDKARDKIDPIKTENKEDIGADIRKTKRVREIVKIADVFDAITTKRPYRKKDFSRDDALNMMLEKSGEEFDPLILKVFVNMMGACPVGTLVLLNTGEIGIIFETNEDPTFMLRPEVKLITDQDGNKVDGEVVDLTERDPKTNTFTRSIIKNLDNNTYNIRIPDYFVNAAHQAV